MVLCTVLGAGVYSFLSVFQLYSYRFVGFLNPREPIHEAQIYFVFCGLAYFHTFTVLASKYLT